MIKLQELTIGCEVLMDGNKIKLSTISDDLKDKIEGIILTEDILLEYGYKKENDKILGEFMYKKDIRGFHITVSDYSNTLGRDWCVHIDTPDYCTSGGCLDIRYLHQLQSFINLTVY